MGTLIVVTGGSRSGKSEFAENLARQRSKKTVYIATAVADDEEMKARVARHQKRRPKEWQTVEAACDLPTVTAQAACKYETVLIVPDNAVSRAFRDVLGRMNSVLAAEADKVYLSVAGLTIDLKKIAVKAEEEI